MGILIVNVQSITYKPRLEHQRFKLTKILSVDLLGLKDQFEWGLEESSTMSLDNSVDQLSKFPITWVLSILFISASVINWWPLRLLSERITLFELKIQQEVGALNKKKYFFTICDFFSYFFIFPLVLYIYGIITTNRLRHCMKMFLFD